MKKLHVFICLFIYFNGNKPLQKHNIVNTIDTFRVDDKGLQLEKFLTETLLFEAGLCSELDRGAMGK